MTKIGLLMIGCVGIAATPGCAEDFSGLEDDQALIAEAEGDVTADALTSEAVTSDPVTPNAIGEFHPIRLVNTQLCLQPLDGIDGDVEVELSQCLPASLPAARAQHWRFQQTASNEWQIINLHSGKCLYVNTPAPLRDRFRPIITGGCSIFGTNVPVSNALWKPSTLAGVATLQSRIQHRDSGFCLDVPFANPFEGATMWMFRCTTNNPAQLWVVGIE